MENFHPTITVHDAASAPLASLAENIGAPATLSGHFHCWHDTMHMLTSYPPQRVEICCHCGAERNVPERANFGQAAGHGPHAPGVHVDWARPGSDESVLVVGTLEETNEAPAPADALTRDSHCWHNTGVVWQMDASKHVDVCCQCARSRLVAEEEATRHGTFKPTCCGRELEVHGVEEVRIVDREFWDAIRNPKPLNIAAPLKDASRD